ncbi:hypothetical protein EVAR_9736_1 [Eumeta japonica]|uniref:Uncharacterized protein n=1 Tax=Eumeta variegata TaxID=151549 RepID=A0A4C1U587_EUMVA|nr:hypothetical protein EVAR_9736_1 [Eumeta japonica]
MVWLPTIANRLMQAIDAGDMLEMSLCELLDADVETEPDIETFQVCLVTNVCNTEESPSPQRPASAERIAFVIDLNRNFQLLEKVSYARVTGADSRDG